MHRPDINRLTGTTHMVGAQDFQPYRGPPPTILPYVREAGFEGPLMLRDFDIDGPPLSSFVERWRPEATYFSSAIWKGHHHVTGCRLSPCSPHRWRSCWGLHERFSAVVRQTNVGHGRGVVRCETSIERR
ncbi:hypothetical protein PIB30_081465 [Stylosanthes scabra]|uniref:Uncharacterized protein n=1 Tax=Stylosanthes scabra TaxID=79078 RepID=A0ABU6SRV6_9FABA|nr:hypothetical protein [Stylosanthes scabra]